MILEADAKAIARAVDILRSGRLVAFPTETVYGLGCDATNDQAVAAVYVAKGRPQFNPLIVHVPTSNDLENIVEWNDKARLLAMQFWPGPLTIIMKRKDHCPVSLLASAGLDTVAVRVPSHPIAQDLLRSFGRPVAAPSANASGKLSPTSAFHVADSLDDRVDLILAGGKSSIGIESTVINLLSTVPTILRPGAVTREQLQRLIGEVNIHNGDLDSSTPVSPGMLASHYAPHIPLRINASYAEAREAFLTFGPDALVKGGAKRLNLSETGDLTEAAANLFHMLRQLDRPDFTGIAVMPIPMRDLGVAINDRLKRAAVVIENKT